jgi:hypothetical protein
LLAPFWFSSLLLNLSLGQASLAHPKAEASFSTPRLALFWFASLLLNLSLGQASLAHPKAEASFSTPRLALFWLASLLLNLSIGPSKLGPSGVWTFSVSGYRPAAAKMSTAEMERSKVRVTSG